MQHDNNSVTVHYIAHLTPHYLLNKIRKPSRMETPVQKQTKCKMEFEKFRCLFTSGIRSEAPIYIKFPAAKGIR